MSATDLKGSSNNIKVCEERKVDNTQSNEEKERKEERQFGELLDKMKGIDGVDIHNRNDNYTIRKEEDSQRKMSVPKEDNEKRELWTRLQKMISNNSELGSRLLSLLLVNSENAKSIIEAVNKGDLSNFDGFSNLRDEANSVKIGKPEKENIATDVVTVMADDQDEIRKREEEKRRRNTEASARFRIRKKEKEKERLKQFERLVQDISSMYDKIDGLMEENQYWKGRLEELNELRSRQLLDSIKRRSGIESNK